MLALTLSSHCTGLKGRLLWQSFVLIVEGALVITFAQAQTLASALGILVLFSIFVQAAEGSTYGIVPYINPMATGSISGIIGAGGNVGAVVFGLFFRELDAKTAFVLMGTVIMCSSVLSLLVQIRGQVRLFLRNDSPIPSIVKKPELLISPCKTATDFESNRSSSPLSHNLELHFPIAADGGSDSDSHQN